MKSHVSMEQEKCLVCAKDFDTGTIILDRRLKNSLESKTLTGWGLCPEHDALYKSGYITLIGADYSKSDHLPNGNVKPEGAYRTGDVLHVKFELFEDICNVPRGDSPVMFCDPAVIEHIKSLMPQGAE